MPDDVPASMRKDEQRDLSGQDAAHAREAWAQPQPSAKHEGAHVAAGSHAHAPQHHSTPAKPRQVRVVALILLVAAGVAAATGIISRRQSDTQLATWTDSQAVPTVAVQTPAQGPATRMLKLPGDVEAFYEAPIYARVDGYLHGWRDDIGARVKQGETLATIDTPDLDQQLTQAKADLAVARANAALADLTSKRWHALLATNSVSQQSADEKAGNAEAAHATVLAQQAHVDRLLALTGFQRLVAPFDGVVTARNTDVGALINSGSGRAEPLFKVADVHAMRIYVRVPQAFASDLTIGMDATITQPQYPGKVFHAKLITTSEAAAMESRTVLVELLADNKDRLLWPGTYAEVSFNLPGDQGVYRVPASALIFRTAGAELATVGKDDRIVMKPVVVGRNFGSEIEIRAGILPADRIVVTPLDSLENGQQVQPKLATQATAE